MEGWQLVRKKKSIVVSLLGRKDVKGYAIRKNYTHSIFIGDLFLPNIIRTLIAKCCKCLNNPIIEIKEFVYKPNLESQLA